MKQAPKRKLFSDASYEAIGGLCLETGVYWKFQLTAEVQLRTVWSKRGKGDRISINILELKAMVMTAYVMIMMKRDTSDTEGATVLIQGDNSSAVQWVITCKGGGKEEVRAGGTDEDIGSIRNERRMVLSGKKNGRRVDNRLAEGITRWKGKEIQKNVTKESPETVWQVQELGKEEQRMCSEILREVTPLDGLRLRLEIITRKIGGWG